MRKEISSKTLEFVHYHDLHHGIIVAEPQILGLIRENLLSQLPKQFSLQALAKDLCKLKPNEIHEYLAEKGFLEARKAVF